MATIAQKDIAAGWTGGAAYLSDTLFCSYSQVFFVRSHLVGGLLFLATCLAPQVMLGGAIAVFVAAVAARLLNLSEALTRSGVFGYNALLVGLGGGAMLEPWPGLLLIAATAVASVVVTAALHSALSNTFNLPVLTVPFLVVFPLMLTTAKTIGLIWLPTPQDALAEMVALPAAVELFLRSLGAIFFVPRVDAGLLVLVALCVYSRIAVLLALVGFGLGLLLGLQTAMVVGQLVPTALGYNFILTAIALGGVWFVPGLSSFVLAAGGVLLAGLFSLGLLPRLPTTLQALILPFNITVLLVLYAMRQRVQDRRPKAVDFLLGTPEQNLNYLRTRVSRFGANYPVRFAAPFLGRWICTQGVDGETTHKGPWREAFDFEVAGDDGEVYRGEGTTLEQYLCYRVPVLATADGTVVKVVSHVPDNPLGQLNLEENWGNLVLIYHAPGLYSMVCHLAPATIKVQEGQAIKRGDTVGLCGNSGRSAVPHIHFQLQGTARVGAPTRLAELHDVCEQRVDGHRLHSTFVPCKGDLVRNLDTDNDIERLLSFTYDEPITFIVSDDHGKRRETIAADIDLFGNLLLRSRDKESTLFYDVQRGQFTVYDVLGDHGSVLQLMRAALLRVPFEAEASLRWEDVLPARQMRAWWKAGLLDFVSPFVAATNEVAVGYRSERTARGLVVYGTSGQRQLETRAVFTHGIGLSELEVCLRGRVCRATRVLDNAPCAPVGGHLAINLYQEGTTRC